MEGVSIAITKTLRNLFNISLHEKPQLTAMYYRVLGQYFCSPNHFTEFEIIPDTKRQHYELLQHSL